MRTILDSVESWRWVPLSAKLEPSGLTIELAEAVILDRIESIEVAPGITIDDTRPVEVQPGSKRVVVHFDHVVYLQVYDEGSQKDQTGEEKDGGVLALHQNSGLLKWLGESTLLLDLTPGDLFHYSLLTGEDVFHVVTRTTPKVWEKPA
jgi:hypothetical protein